MEKEVSAQTREGNPENVLRPPEEPASFEALSQAEKNEVAVLYREWFSGPLPHPETLAQYEAVVPGSGKAIMENMLLESAHRRDMEKMTLSDGAEYANRGMRDAFFLSVTVSVFGFAIAALSIVFAEGAVQIVGAITGTTLSGTTLIGLVGKFIDGRRAEKRNAEKEDDEEQIEGQSEAS